MRILRAVFFVILLGGVVLRAEVAPVELSVEKEEAWTGEKVSLYVELRAKGSFSGSAAFDLPEIPGSLIVKVGNPVVGSKEIEGESWFTQRHEFALFSQKSGVVEIPSFPVRFQARENFTGPARAVAVTTASVSVAIKRPPGSEEIPFLVTTAEFAVEESWDPVPGESARVGDVFRRRIVQRAVNLPGMALLPASTEAPDGVRIYPPQVETSDNTERGAFDGERRDTLTYLLQEDGSVVLPELTYTWWDPRSKRLQSRSLPAVALEVLPGAVAEPPATERFPRRLTPWFAAIALVSVLVWQRRRVVGSFRYFHRLIDPPERVAARRLRRSCRRNDAEAAHRAWSRWLQTTGRSFETKERLKKAVMEMQRVTFGPGTDGPWNGAELDDAFREQLSLREARLWNYESSPLPRLNP